MMQRCFFCKGDMVESTTNYMIDLGDRSIIIKNVPCNDRSQCGEISFSGTTASRLDAIVEDLKGAIAEVSVVEYAA